MLNLTDELSTAKEQRLNQFGLSVLVRCSKSVWCGKSLRTDDDDDDKLYSCVDVFS